MAGEAELHLRERLNRLRSLPLLRGARLSGELERLQRQLERIVAEPGALMSFAGPRVVQQITREKLPDDFGQSESNLAFGHIDAVVPRPELPAYVARLLRLFARAG